MTSVAVLGTGRMGGAIARRLSTKGIDVSVWDRTSSKAEALSVGRVARSPADAVRGAEVVISMVTGPSAVRDVYFSPAGVFEVAAERAITIVEMSTAGPGITRELAIAAERNGAKLIEAPVLGSVPAVESGTLVILAGADKIEDLAAARPILQHLGEVHYVGEPGSAAALKLVANAMLAIVSAAAAELLSAATHHGLNPEQVFWALARIAPGLRVREAGFVRDVHLPTMFAMRDLVKDLDLGLALFQPDPGSGSKVPLTALVRELFAGVASRAPELDITAIVKAYSKERQAAQAKEASS
jgi:3-hydroxyisobutyrate dehydrogenase